MRGAAWSAPDRLSPLPPVVQGRLLVGCGPILRLYEMGRKKLLRKCEYKRCVRASF